ncbi:hypothetical protein BH09BAC4_BH09BAC4_35350 [soil metagenome]
MNLNQVKSNVSAILASLLFAWIIGLHASQAQTPEESSLIAHLVKGANMPGAHSEGDVYLLVKVGKIEYITELASGAVVDQRNAGVIGGGICGDYAEVSLNLLDKNKQETAQGAGQVLKVNKGKWKMIALSEGDYACEKLKGISKAVLACLNVECY